MAELPMRTDAAWENPNYEWNRTLRFDAGGLMMIKFYVLYIKINFRMSSF